MKNFTILSSLLGAFISLMPSQQSYAQTSACTFVSPAVELNYTSTNVNGDCMVNVDLSFTININNGNKYTVLHLWPEASYPSPSFLYSVNNAPQSSQGGGNGALDNALATIIINRNSNPASLLSGYSIDPTIDDNTLPCINQVKDASDGLVLQVTDVGNGNVFYLIKNLSLPYPGGCSQPIKFKGDAWSSNASSLNVQCTMLGFTYLSNVPTMTALQICQRPSSPAQYQFTVSTALPNYSVDYSVDIYADVDKNGEFNPFVDNQHIASYPAASLPDVSSTSPYSVAPTAFSWSATQNNNSLFFILGNITVTNTVSSQVTQYLNTIISTTTPDCNTPLPLNNLVISGTKEGMVNRLSWKVPVDETRYAVEKMPAGSSQWRQIGVEKMKENTSGSGYETYIYTDLEAKDCLYRVRAFNPDGAFAYSNTIKLESNHAPIDIQIFPNPATSSTVRLIADLPDEQTATILVVNPLGQVIYEYTHVNGGEITVGNLSSGIYYILMYSDHKERVMKTLAIK